MQWPMQEDRMKDCLAKLRVSRLGFESFANLEWPAVLGSGKLVPWIVRISLVVGVDIRFVMVSFQNTTGWRGHGGGHNKCRNRGPLWLAG